MQAGTVADNNGSPVVLDLFSTSQTNRHFDARDYVSHDLYHETRAAIEEAEIRQTTTCQRGAPYIFWVDGSGACRLAQGCCNNWKCPRCSVIRAKQEYGRILEGARELSEKHGQSLFFFTSTCTGSVSVDEADKHYHEWNNRLWTNVRTKAKRAGMMCEYVSITERQKRGHAHSHTICTFCPDDAVLADKWARLPNGAYAKHECLWSGWWHKANVSAGLGEMCDLSLIAQPIAVAVYIAKYLFKDISETEFPPKWKRIRYSQSFPKLPKMESALAFPVLTQDDWRKVAIAVMGGLKRLICEDVYTLEAARARGIRNSKLRDTKSQLT